MRIRNLNLAAALATLAALILPLTASAGLVAPNVTGSLMGPATNASILLENDSAAELKIFKVELDLSTAIGGSAFWMWHGTAVNPDGGPLDGFTVAFTGGDQTAFDEQLILDIIPVGTVTPGFNGGEKLKLQGMDIRNQPGLDAPPLMDLAGTKVTVWFEYDAGSAGGTELDEPWVGVFTSASGSTELALVPVPEPSTGAMLVLGLSGLALASRRRF